MSNEQNTWFIRHHFSQLSNVVLNKSGNRPTKRCQGTRHVFKSLLIKIQEFAWIEVFYEIVDFFVLNVWFNWFSLHLRKKKLIQNLLSTKLIIRLISNITLSVSTYKYKLKQVPSQVSVNLLWISIIVLWKY